MTNARFVIALDQGTTSSRAVLINRAGAIVGMIQNEFPQYEVLGDDLIRVFCPVSYSSKINTKLVSSGIEVCEIGIAGMNPQTFLSALAGGEAKNVSDYSK